MEKLYPDFFCFLTFSLFKDGRVTRQILQSKISEPPDVTYFWSSEICIIGTLNVLKTHTYSCSQVAGMKGFYLV